MVALRSMPWLALALAFYLLVEVASRRALDSIGIGLALAAILSIVSPVVVLSGLNRQRPSGAWLILLGVAVGLFLLAFLQPSLQSIPTIPALISLSLAALAPMGIGLAAWRLAYAMPRSGLHEFESRASSATWALLAVSLAATGLVGALRGSDLRLLWLAPLAWIGCVLVGSAVVRCKRQRAEVDPLLRASNLWGIFSLLPAIALAAAAWLGAALWLYSAADAAPSSQVDYAPFVTMSAIRGAVAAVGVCLVAGHVALFQPRWRYRVHDVLRSSLGMVAVVAFYTVTSWVLQRWLSERGLAVLIAAVLAVVFATSITGRLRRAVGRLWLPRGGRLVSAAQRAVADLESAGSLEAIARACLVPLQRVFDNPEAEPCLCLVAPNCELRIDAGEALHRRSRAMPEALLLRLLQGSNEILSVQQIERQATRQSDHRPLHQALQELQALCVVPLMADGELTGALILPQGRDARPLHADEWRHLMLLAHRLSSRLGLAAAAERMGGHATNAVEEAIATRRQLADTERTLELVRSENRLLRCAETAEEATAWVAYSQAMQRLGSSLNELAASDLPVLFAGEAGIDALSVARRLHNMGANAAGPWLVVDCCSVAPARLPAALFGSGQEPGWLQLAAGGSLCLLHPVALDARTQHRLADTLATRRVANVDATQAPPLEARLLLVSRLGLAEWQSKDALQPELRRWFELTSLRLPPLRERRQDLPSLLLLAADRICRMRGGEVPLGFHPAALARLQAYDWPGNLLELNQLLERVAESKAQGRIELKDLPAHVRRTRAYASASLVNEADLVPSA